MLLRNCLDSLSHSVPSCLPPFRAPLRASLLRLQSFRGRSDHGCPVALPIRRQWRRIALLRSCRHADDVAQSFALGRCCKRSGRRCSAAGCAGADSHSVIRLVLKGASDSKSQASQREMLGHACHSCNSTVAQSRALPGGPFKFALSLSASVMRTSPGLSDLPAWAALLPNLPHVAQQLHASGGLTPWCAAV